MIITDVKNIIKANAAPNLSQEQMSLIPHPAPVAPSKTVSTPVVSTPTISAPVAPASSTLSGSINQSTKVQGNSTANDIIGKNKKGAINREFPDEWRGETYDDIVKAAKRGDKSAQKAKKLLEDKRFDKGDNRK